MLRQNNESSTLQVIKNAQICTHGLFNHHRDGVECIIKIEGDQAELGGLGMCVAARLRLAFGPSLFRRRSEGC